MNDRPSTVSVNCTECGERVKLSNRMTRAYCPVCTSRLAFKDAQKGILNSDPNRDDQIFAVDVTCTECGAGVRVSNRMAYAFCPVCTSKISFKDAQIGLLSEDLIASISGAEFDRLVKSTEVTQKMNLNDLELAASRGSVLAAITIASHYLKEKDYMTAKKYFELPAVKNIPDAVYGALACSLEGDCDSDTVLEQIENINRKKFRYLSKEVKQQLDEIVVEEENKRTIAKALAEAIVSIADNIAENKKEKSEYVGGYSSYSGSYHQDSTLSRSELAALNRSICHDLWNPYAIDNSDLSDSQKQQLKDYNRIYGD